ncbi:hypothetical protein [Microbacterium sp. gxy059]|uniref:hypothetical protein n=1 Tax=Microbacterium sp. gxy059 TaxID=2957199 RepID=UPI003D989D0D
MRRRPPSPNSALRGVSLLSTAVIAVLIASLAPQAAAGTVDDGAEAAVEQPAPAGGASPEEDPDGADDASTEPAAEEASEAAEEDERAGEEDVPAEEDAPADDEQPAEEAPVDDETAPEAEPDLGIPTPEAGDYLGSMTIDEADPGAYAESRGLEAYRLNDFRPGNIIADSQMYTSGTMSASAIQKFFDGKVSSCQSGYTCLKDFRQSTATKAPNAYCAGSYQGAKNETAAAIISKVSKACGVSEKVLIVMLQKEQGLVTHTWPSDWRYDIAMGYACPDDAACDAKYFGFQNQMYHAAYQLQRYTKDSYFSWYPVGKTSQVLWHPNASCGSGAVKIENKATAALYYYTPYQPNRASLAAGYGASSDKCASYGNRNFYNYYTDWFGSAHTPPKPQPSCGVGSTTSAVKIYTVKTSTKVRDAPRADCDRGVTTLAAGTTVRAVKVTAARDWLQVWTGSGKKWIPRSAVDYASDAEAACTEPSGSVRSASYAFRVTGSGTTARTAPRAGCELGSSTLSSGAVVQAVQASGSGDWVLVQTGEGRRWVARSALALSSAAERTCLAPNGGVGPAVKRYRLLKTTPALVGPRSGCEVSDVQLRTGTTVQATSISGTRQWLEVETTKGLRWVPRSAVVKID